MADLKSSQQQKTNAHYQDELVRLNKIIQALMNKAERTLSVHGSAFGLFESTVRLEEEVRRRTAELESALRENERINRALQLAQDRMREEISQRQQFEEKLKKANLRLERLSTTDPLTGLANRRRFMESLATEWHRSLRDRRPIGLAIADIDFFKKYNDHYGHPAGDTCLQKVATTLKNSVRRTDLAARYGGEEFAIIFPNTDYETVFQVADRARLGVYSLQEPHAEVDSGILTVSVGVTAMVPSNYTTTDQLIALADAALYEAKRDGRNCVRGNALESSEAQPAMIEFKA